MTTYHLVSSPTVVATLKSARRAQNTARPIRIEASGTPEDCYAAFLRIFTGVSVNATLEEITQSNLARPVAVTPSTTYHIVADQTSGVPVQTVSANELESRRWLRDSAVRSGREAIELVVKRRESELLEVKRVLERFDEAAVQSKLPKAERPSWYSKPSSVLTNAIHAFVQVGSNDRIDLIASRIAELVTTESWEG